MWKMGFWRHMYLLLHGAEKRGSKKSTPRQRHGLGGIHGHPSGPCRKLTGMRTCSRWYSQRALLMMKVGAWSVASIREPPAHTFTLHRKRAAAAITRTTFRMAPSESDPNTNVAHRSRSTCDLAHTC